MSNNGASLNYLLFMENLNLEIERLDEIVQICGAYFEAEEVSKL